MPEYKEIDGNNKEPGLDFMVSFNGTQPEIDSKERELVSAKFEALTEDTLLGHADSVRHESATPGFENDSLRLTGVNDKGGEYELYVCDRIGHKPPRDGMDSADDILKNINIREKVGDRRPNHYSYRLGGDGIVRRVDIAAKPSFAKSRLANTAIKGADLSLEMSQEALKETVNGWRNHQLERNMGLNDQPIGLSEIQGLEDFVRQPGFQPVN